MATVFQAPMTTSSEWRAAAARWCLVKPVESPLATHCPALATFLLLFFGVDVGAPLSYAPAWRYVLPVSFLWYIVTGAVMEDSAGQSFFPLYTILIIAWATAPAWTLPLRYLQPLLRVVFDQRSQSKGVGLQDRIFITWFVEHGLGAFPLLVAVGEFSFYCATGTPAPLHVVQGPLWLRTAQAVGSWVWVPCAWMMFVSIATLVSSALLILSLHCAQIDLLAHHWKHRTRHQFLEAQPPEVRPCQHVFMRCPQLPWALGEWCRIRSARLLVFLNCFAKQGSFAHSCLSFANGTPSANDYVFTILASARGTIPANPTKITFWVKGTSAKSLSLNVYRSTTTTNYDVFNVGNLSTGAVILSKAALNTSNNGTNSYTGTIDTNGQWVKVTLNLSDVSINNSNTGDIFALKVGSNSLYNLQIDNIEIQ